MFVRAGVLFCVIALAATLAMQFLVQDHVKGVGLVHAQDKTLHRTDMISNLAGLDHIFEQDQNQESLVAEIQRMAHDTDIFETAFYDLSGRRILVFANPIAEGERTAHSHVTHSGHADHLAIATAPMMLPVAALGQTIPQETGPSILLEVSNFPVVTAIGPLHNQRGEQLGYVRYQVDVGDVLEAYSAGLSRFAIVLVAFGAAIFGIPALGYTIQKRIADRSRSNAKYLADFDALTGLLNRRGFMVRAAANYAKGTVAHIAYLDADQFKSINDTYGHAIGDAYLQSISASIKEIFGDQVLASRLGGDEFVIVDSAPSHDAFVHSLERLRQNSADEVDLNGVTIRSSISAGVASFEADHTLEDLLSEADLALYFAKSSGGNCVSVYNNKMAADMERRRMLEARLREAVIHKDFTLHYQPLISSKTQDIYGYEALLRLEGDDGEFISPEEFVPIAERMGLIEEIGTWVIQTATRQIAEMNSHDMVAINLSSEQFKSGQLLGIVKDALSHANLSCFRLELEITESLLLDESPAVAAQIDALKDMGISVAMDDFGTGFSSLSYLWKFGFDRIKIDRSFIHALEEDPIRSLGLVESIVMLGKKLDMEITAEGIETQKQSEILSSLGCDVLQGYYYGHPEPLSLNEIEPEEAHPVAKSA